MTIKKTVAAIIIIIGGGIILSIIVMNLFTAFLGTKSKESINTYLINNNSLDTLYIEKPKSQERTSIEFVIIKNKPFFKVPPKTLLYFLTIYDLHSTNEGLSVSPIKDTFELIRQKDTLAFIYPLKDKCTKKETDLGIEYTRTIDD